ncbi:hypothetical protein [Sinorhizobium medicae]|uniref:hypothetical protein n=1 Tax=Sinorhizobium medicae TaxID=110321 RepID=UPI000C7A0F2B|nr:hypothetical protein [Sinorhizobium medicae]MDX0512753.1 hypothetical protein [Sinorhizobium medicae]MDX0937367.1 hypothetical protein [Sinorhizobium medicae]MDX0943526.1 hypothetical protein [Sinorhizobium medicae]MDX0949024.1 hypothetical protein [Sinorhizobium medicae]MDX1010713.1 hypothetical protein [Sinorhizobium medicae]
MPRSSFRQADLDRIFRAAKKVGAVVQIDLRTFQVTILPSSDGVSSTVGGLAPDGKENWDEFDF